MNVVDWPIDGDAGDGEGGDEGDADGDHAGQLTHPLNLGPEPSLVHDLNQGNRTHQGAKKQVAHGQVDYQNVVHLKVTFRTITFNTFNFDLNNTISNPLQRTI